VIRIDEQIHSVPLPAIIPHERAQAALTALARTAKTRGSASSYPLSTRLISLCGAGMVGNSRPRTPLRVLEVLEHLRRPGRRDEPALLLPRQA
jgi:hypothetical protein